MDPCGTLLSLVELVESLHEPSYSPRRSWNPALPQKTEHSCGTFLKPPRSPRRNWWNPGQTRGTLVSPRTTPQPSKKLVEPWNPAKWNLPQTTPDHPAALKEIGGTLVFFVEPSWNPRGTLVEPYLRPPQTTPQPLKKLVEPWWKPDGSLVEPWWNPGGTLVEPWWNSWNLRGTLVEPYLKPPRTTPQPLRTTHCFPPAQSTEP